MRERVTYMVILLIGVLMALYHVGSITAYAKEDGDFLRGGVQSITHI